MGPSALRVQYSSLVHVTPVRSAVQNTPVARVCHSLSGPASTFSFLLSSHFPNLPGGKQTNAVRSRPGLSKTDVEVRE